MVLIINIPGLGWYGMRWPNFFVFQSIERKEIFESGKNGFVYMHFDSALFVREREVVVPDYMK